MKKLLLALFTGLFGFSASAAQVTLDFEDVALGSRTANFTTQGFAISAACHYNIRNSTSGPNGTFPPAPYGNWIGTNASGCTPDNQIIGMNDNYLGPQGVGAGTNLYIGAPSGQQFDVLSFIFAAATDDIGGYTLFSSKGGSADFSYVHGGNFGFHALSGAAWEGLDWIVFSVGPVGASVGFDQLVLAVNAVPEPDSIALLTLGLLAVGAARRRKS